MISKCNCSSEYQDKKYGKGNRVFNPMGQSRSVSKGIARCSVCSRVLQSTSGVVNQGVKSDVLT